MGDDIKIPVTRGTISASGIASYDDHLILVGGVVQDWSLLISPIHFRIPPESGSDNDNVMSEVRVWTDVEGNGWRVKGGVRWRRGLGNPLEWDNSALSILKVGWIVVRKNSSP